MGAKKWDMAWWRQVEQEMDSFFSGVNLYCDGDIIQTAMLRDRNKLVLKVFVNGFVKGVWLTDTEGKCPETRYFRKRFMNWKKRELELWGKVYGKREFNRRKKAGEYDPKHVMNDPYWPSAKAFCVHLRKICQEVRYATQPELDAIKANVAEEA